MMIELHEELVQRGVRNAPAIDVQIVEKATRERIRVVGFETNEPQMCDLLPASHTAVAESRVASRYQNTRADGGEREEQIEQLPASCGVEL
jgi:uncharacterized protein YbaP (TraB family)